MCAYSVAQLCPTLCNPMDRSLPGSSVDGVIQGRILIRSDQIRSVTQSSDSLQTHESQHARPPCPSPTPRAHPDSRPSSQWCHPAISSSVVPFSSCPQSLPASESFPMTKLFAWGGQSTGVSVLASFLPKKSQGWSPSEWTGWISLQSKGLSRVFSNTRILKWVAISSSRGSSHSRDQTHVSGISCIARQTLYHWATRETP